VRPLVALLVGVLAVAPAAASPPALAGPAEARADSGLRQALDRLLDEDVRGAAPAIEAHAAARPDDAAGLAALGILRVFQHRYPEAVETLTRAGFTAERDLGGWLAIARNAAALQRDHDTAESEHFLVSYPRGKDQVLVPYLLEALEAQRAALAEDLGVAPGWKVRVEILNGVAELSRLSSLTDREIRASGTIALCKYDKLMITSPKALVQGYDWLDTAAHEYTHYVMTLKTANRAPIWLQEGIAKWSETRWRGAGGESFSPFSAALLRQAIDADDLVTFDEMHPSMAKLPTQERAALAFAEVVMAVEYLVREGPPGVLAKVLDGVAAGQTAEAAVSAALGRPFQAFLAGWRRHMVQRPMPRGGEHALARLRFKDDPKQAGPWAEWADLPSQQARDHARLGQLFRQRGRWTPARVEYGKAVAIAGARVPILASQFAVAAMMSGRKAEAEKALAEGIDWNPEYPALRVQMARLLLDRKEPAKARAHLVEANRQDPFDPEIHAGLALALEALGDPGGASRERRFAEILAGHGGGPEQDPSRPPPVEGAGAPSERP
jgi:tetratricopeptide (TPR) repeat protein